MSKLPEIRVFAGPNGSGKSTITTEEWIIPPYINADDIARECNVDALTAAKQAEALRNDAVDNRQSFTFETVLSTERNLLLLERARSAGFFIKGYYIFPCDPSINIARVMMRVAHGGHDVPKEKIVSRYWKSRAMIPRFISVCDICHIYDSSGETPVRIVRKHKTSLTIFPNERWTTADIRKLINI